MPQYVLGEIRMLAMKSLEEQKMFTRPPQIFLFLNAAPPSLLILCGKRSKVGDVVAYS